MEFVAAVCPQCGVSLQVDPEKESGFCVHCGTKIVIQEAIRTVRIDNSHMIDTWMDMADAAEKSGNHEEAYEYYTKAVETQPENWQAYIGRGMAIGNQTTLNNSRLLEAAVNFLRAMYLVPKDDAGRTSLIITTATELAAMGNAMIKLRTDEFEKHPDIVEAWSIKGDLDEIKHVFEEFQGALDVDISGYQEIIASNILASVVSTYNNKLSIDYFGEEGHPTADEVSEYRIGIERCLDVLLFAKRFTKNDDLIVRINNNMIKLNEASINSVLWDCSWTSSGKIWRKRQIPTSMSERNRNNVEELKRENSSIMGRSPSHESHL